jgi:hypothetical protein
MPRTAPLPAAEGRSGRSYAGRKGPAGEGGRLQQHVNDRPYAANSFLSVALGRHFSTALSGGSKERAELADTSLPLSAKLPVVAARGGADLVCRLFETVGYAGRR